MPSLMRYINVVSRCGAIFRSEKLKNTGLGDTHHSYILCVCRNPGITQDALARRLFINKSNVTRTLAQLEGMGLVRREQSQDDKRVINVYPTEKAQELLPEVRSILKEWREYLTEDLDESEKAQLEVLLAKIAKKAADYAEVSEEAFGDLDSDKNGDKNGDSK